LHGKQWRVADNKLRLDLFDRRYKVYDATRKFLAAILRDATFTDSQLFEFYGGTSDTEFLFRSEVVDYLAQIRKRALDMRLHRKLFEPLPVGGEKSRHVQAHHDELSWLSDQLTAMTSVFAPYLDFSRVKLRAFPFAVQMSKRSIAREWLLFLALLPLGFASCLFLGYYWENFRTAYFSTYFLDHHHGKGDYPAYDAFWNDAFGLGNLWTLALWLVPYLIVVFIRSVWWSIKTLSTKHE
jgi:hypothetical protein